MIRITELPSPEQAEKYYNKHLNLEAYYSENQEFNGYWGGEGARLLGLGKYLTDEGFSRLLRNQHPITGKQLTPRMREDRRTGWDISFDVPKSVSLAWAYSKDERIIRLVRESVAQVATEMEEAASTRVRAGLDNSADEDRVTASWVYAEYVHLTARPQDGYADPQIHVHLVVPNVAFDPVEKRWKALQMGRIHEEIQSYEGAFHRLLQEKLRELGLETTPTQYGFEIEGISRDLIERFSRRTKTINATAERLGITDPAQKAKLGALTRQGKDKNLLISDMEPFWWDNLPAEHENQLKPVAVRLERSRAIELNSELMAAMPESVGYVDISRASEVLGSRRHLKAVKPQRRVSLNQKTRPRPKQAKVVKATEHDREAVRLALIHSYERASVVTERQLIGKACKMWCVGKATYAGIKRVVAELPLLRRKKDGRVWVTTPEVLAEESRLIDWCLDGKCRYEALNRLWKIEDERLNEQQRNAVLHVLNSQDRVMGISGKAGTGKTTLLHEVRRGIEAGFNKFIALAPTSEAARDTLRNEGFSNAETVAKFLISETLQKEAKGAVLLVDEAGLLSTRQAVRLFALAQKLGARVLLVGDTGQHHSVERGQAFKLLEKFGRLSVAQVSEIQRQKADYKRLVELVTDKKLEKAFELLNEMNAIYEMKPAEHRLALANDYVNAIERGKTALVVAPTHLEGHMVTEGIRQALKEKGRLKEATQWDTLRDLSWTRAQKSDCDHYRQGMVVQFNGHVPGFALGERVEVVGVRDEVVRVRSTRPYGSRIHGLPLAHAESFNVHEREKLEICEGDLVQITCNGRSSEGHRLINGKRYKIDYIGYDGQLVLENGWRLDRNFAHLKHGYAYTSHGSQGKTVDCVLLSQTTTLSAPASDLRQFYVSISRARSEIKIYTDNIERLKELVSKVRERPMATEILYQEKANEPSENKSEKVSNGLGRQPENANTQLQEMLSRQVEQMHQPERGQAFEMSMGI